MSAPHRDDFERDEALDAAWRAQSRELPPPSLDAAILAAARREARSRPAPVGESASVAQARKPPRAWWGLAAAATIGAIAFGVLQHQPREAPSTQVVVSDAPAPPAQRESAPEPAPPPPPSVSAERANEGSQPKRRDANATRDAVKAPPVPASPPAPQVAATPPPPVSVPPPGVTLPKPIEAPTFAGTAPPVADAAPAASQPHAFPGSAAREEKAEAPVQREGESRARIAAAPPAPAELAAGQAAGAARADAQVARKQSAPLAMRAAVAPQTFITRIEELMRAGRRDEAARELRTFRGAYADADERLPASLREWAATVPRD